MLYIVCYTNLHSFLDKVLLFLIQSNSVLTIPIGLNTIPQTLYYCDGVLINRVVGVVSVDQINQAMKV